MNLKEFKYNLPEELIAQYPLTKRDQARLMIIDRKNNSISHDYFYNINSYLPENSSVVLNTSKVVPVRLLGNREDSGGSIEIFLLKKLPDGYCYEVLMKPLRRLNVGEKFYFDDRKLVAELISKDKPVIKFNKKNILPHLEKVGHMPLPPYIKRMDDAKDKKYYQTVYADKPGSVASPTAGLHFTKRLLNEIKRKHSVEEVMLHVNYGTFKSVEEEDVLKHKMHSEEFSVTKKSFK